MRKVSEEFYSLSAVDINGKDYKFQKLKGKVVIIVNSATKCGFADNAFKNLIALAEKYKGKNLKILIFPCSQFLGQELDDEEKIKENIEKKTKEFMIFGKVDVKGKNIHPVFQFLIKHLKGTFIDDIKWNFTKFLIDQNGIPTKRYGSFDPINVDDPLVEDLLMNN